MVQVGLPLGGVPPSIPMARVAAWELELIGSHGKQQSMQSIKAIHVAEQYALRSKQHGLQSSLIGMGVPCQYFIPAPRAHLLTTSFQTFLMF